LFERRKFPILDVIQALGALSQPELLEPRQFAADLVLERPLELTTGAVVTPVAAPNRSS